ncbi:hypothetical protein [Actinosynnema sp. NPDC023587]|uniref:hypothetical protein n=1 Tax=Actinosynnema sp. NPDC023587 TaxID=3154695 RepID=UPI0033F5D900
MNTVEIVVTGKDKFSATRDAIVKKVEGIKSAADNAAKSVGAVEKAAAKPSPAAIDRLSQSLVRADAKASAAADGLERVADTAAKTDRVADSLDEATAAAERLVARVARLGDETASVAERMPLGLVFRDAARESGAALDELVLSLWRTGSEAGEALYRGLRLDRLQSRMRSVGQVMAEALDRGLEPARRLRAVLLGAASSASDAWDQVADAVDSAAAASVRAAAVIGSTWMLTVRRVRTSAAEAKAAVVNAWDDAMDRVQTRAAAARMFVVDTLDRMADRVAVRASRIGDAMEDAFDRAMAPARMWGARTVEVADQVEAAWTRATVPVVRFGRAVLDVSAETARLTGRVVGPFGRVAVAIGDVLGDAGRRGGQALSRGIDDSLDRTLASVKFWSGHVVALARSTWESAGEKADAMRKGFGRAKDKTISSFTEMADKITGSLPRALNSPALMGAIAAAGLPLGAAAGGAIVLGFGGGLAALGMVTTARTAEVRTAFQRMSDDVSGKWAGIAEPWRKTMVNVSEHIGDAFDKISPRLSRSFDTLAPAVSRFSGKFFDAWAGFDLEPLSRGASRVMDDLGGRMPGIVDSLSENFDELAESIERNPKALGQLVEAGTGLAGHLIGDLGNLNSEFGAIGEEIEMFTNFFRYGKYEVNAEIGLTADGESMIVTSGRIDAMFKDIAKGAAATGRSTYDAKTASEQLESAWRALADAGDDLAERGSGIQTLLDQIAGRTPSYEEATQQINDGIRGLSDTFSDATNHADGYGNALVGADGKVNTLTKNGSDLQDTIINLQSGFSNAAAAVRELEDAGWSHDAAVLKVNTDMIEQYNRLVAVGQIMGLTETQMESLLGVYGLTPKSLDTIARLDENGVPQRLDAMARNRTVTYTAQYVDYGNPNTSHDNSRRSNTGWGVGGYAHGGVSGGGWTTVGELGPERVKLTPGAQVQPYTESRRQLEPAGMTTGGSSAGFTFDFANIGRAGGLDRLFIDWLKNMVRSRGGQPEVFG